ncbi:MAG TPA: 16S rRNA (guanine(527)-N(7))-methyltransferase RsmG [Anaerolineae bacterium]|nr:16S rRNA (guanine(527)-N(7))-methyltransferase RsmG [Anaerolineae bacterium]
MTDLETFRQVLADGAAHFGITLDNERLSLFERYTALLTRWNSHMNLISAQDLHRFVEYHLLDSLKTASCINMNTVSKMLDFGSGAGLPGIPLAIAFPHMSVILVESRLKRCRFLTNVLEDIPHLHASVVRSRLEELPDNFHDTVDMVITRATVSLERFFRLAVRFVSNHGSLAAIKGDSIDDELHALHQCVDTRFFRISSLIPEAYKNVRQGTIVCITRL